MTKKYSPRSMPIITRQSYDVEKSPVAPSWMKEFANSLEKVSVEPMRNEPSLYDQISSIMGGTIKSKYPTVAAAVEDMKKRTGLEQYLNQTVANEGSQKKKAQLDIEKSKAYCDGCQTDDANCKCEEGCTCCLHCLLKKKTNSKEIELFKKLPQVKITVDNYLEDTRGNLPLPAVLQKIKSIHSIDVSDDSMWNDENFLRYLKDKSLEVKQKNPSSDANYSNLGKVPQFNDTDIDPSNTDALHSLMPTTGK